MSHITCDAEREENKAIWACPYRSVPIIAEEYNDWTGEVEYNWKEENQCGEFEYISVAKDKCKRCGKVFTY